MKLTSKVIVKHIIAANLISLSFSERELVIAKLGLKLDETPQWMINFILKHLSPSQVSIDSGAPPRLIGNSFTRSLAMERDKLDEAAYERRLQIFEALDKDAIEVTVFAQSGSDANTVPLDIFLHAYDNMSFHDLAHNRNHNNNPLPLVIVVADKVWTISEEGDNIYKCDREYIKITEFDQDNLYGFWFRRPVTIGDMCWTYGKIKVEKPVRPEPEDHQSNFNSDFEGDELNFGTTHVVNPLGKPTKATLAICGLDLLLNEVLAEIEIDNFN